jgi:hypothetical protein
LSASRAEDQLAADARSNTRITPGSITQKNLFSIKSARRLPSAAGVNTASPRRTTIALIFTSLTGPREFLLLRPANRAR